MIKNKKLFVVILMWFITIISSEIILWETEYIKKLGPVYLICMLVSVFAIKKLK